MVSIEKLPPLLSRLPPCLQRTHKQLVTEPIVQTAVLIGLLALPMSMTPSLIVWAYDKILWFSEPVWVICEVLGLLKLMSLTSQKLVLWIDDQPVVAKATYLGDQSIVLSPLVVGISTEVCTLQWMFQHVASILGLTGLCYFIICDMTMAVVAIDSLTLKWVLMVVFFGASIVHFVMYFTEDGMVLDAAVLSAWTISLVYSMTLPELAIIHSEPTEGLSDSMSFLSLLWTVYVNGLGNVNAVLTFIQGICHPWFIFSMVVRIYSIFVGFQLFKEWMEQDEEYATDEDDDDDEEDESLTRILQSWRSPLLLRLAIIFVYTQAVMHHFMPDSNPTHVLIQMVSFFQHSVISLSKMFQIILANGLYLYYLLSQGEFDWSDS